MRLSPGDLKVVKDELVEDLLEVGRDLFVSTDVLNRTLHLANITDVLVQTNEKLDMLVEALRCIELSLRKERGIGLLVESGEIQDWLSRRRAVKPLPILKRK